MVEMNASIRSNIKPGQRVRIVLKKDQSTGKLTEGIVQTILTKELNVRQTEELVRLMSGHKSPRPEKPGPGAEVLALEERLRSSLGTRVTLNRRRKGGTMVIHYYSDEELDALVERIIGND